MFRDPYVHKPPSMKVVFTGPGRTDQSFKNECDINYIVKNFVTTKSLPPHLLNARNAVFEDVSEVGDFQAALETVQAGNLAFATLPADLRDRFNNDPGRFLDWLYNPDNRAEAISLGLVKKPLQGATPPAGNTPEPAPTPAKPGT